MASGQLRAIAAANFPGRFARLLFVRLGVRFVVEVPQALLGCLQFAN